MQNARLFRLLLALVALALVAASCGGSDASDPISTDSGSSDSGSSDSGADSSDDAADADSSDAGSIDTSSKPEIAAPVGDPPTELIIEDLVVGDGEEAVAGASISVDYVGVSWSTGEEFDASWDRGSEFGFSLGVGQVIAGWDEGVQGMLVGGRRQITIPPDMAYGANGAGGAIGPNETLIFVVDLRAIN